MTDDALSARLTRRNILVLAATGGGAIAIGAALVVPANAQSKVAQKAVAYRPKPNGKARCDGCAYWQAPGSCKVVLGTIAPTGWCSIYAAKS